MTTLSPAPVEPAAFRPLFLADWDDVAFVHYAVDPAALQPLVPFELDLFEGRAYVSLVAFTQRHLRPRTGGALAALAATPLASHPFLNVRTYVRHNGEPGIYFLCEWIPNRLAALVGPPLYGLPYRLGRLRYQYDRAGGLARHRIAAAITGSGAAPFRRDPKGSAFPDSEQTKRSPSGCGETRARNHGIERVLSFETSFDAEELGAAKGGTLDEFLIERYTAFTLRGAQAMCFRVRHEPWPVARARVRMQRVDLLELAGLPVTACAPALAHCSPGVRDVGLGPPADISGCRFAPTRRGALFPAWNRQSAPLRVAAKCGVHRIGAVEALTPHFSWAVLLALVSVSVAAGRHLLAWEYMWLLAGAVFFGCKVMTLWGADAMARVDLGRLVGYVVGWYGLDARTFLHSRHQAGAPSTMAWAKATAKVLAGAALLWGAGRLLPATSPTLLAWIGMFGLVLMLHFGLFEILSLLWQSAGVNARPLMDRPLQAASLADFWGRRWNTAFTAFAHRNVFRPLSRKVGSATALVATFVFSGIVHDLVISVPARGGYGLPTAYFTLQALGTLFERSRLGTRLGLGHGLRGRLFTAMMTAGPAYWLFHPAFVSRVAIPFLRAVGAIRN